MQGVLPPVEILDFGEETAPLVARPLEARLPRPPGRTATRLARLRHRYDATVGLAHGYSPRMHPRVEHRVEGNVRAIVERMGMAFHYDPVEHEYRTPMALRVRWSWPRLPMWLSVAELSPTRSALRLTLRSRRRLRYPLRYFHVTHEVLTDVESDLRGAVRSG